jgi:hypothetical protein
MGQRRKVNGSRSSSTSSTPEAAYQQHQHGSKGTRSDGEEQEVDEENLSTFTPKPGKLLSCLDEENILKLVLLCCIYRWMGDKAHNGFHGILGVCGILCNASQSFIRHRLNGQHKHFFCITSREQYQRLPKLVAQSITSFVARGRPKRGGI